MWLLVAEYLTRTTGCSIYSFVSVCDNLDLCIAVSLLISMAPLSQEIYPVTSVTPPHIGPAIPEVNSVWFRLWLYDQLGCGPPTILFTKGTRLRHLPEVFQVMTVCLYVCKLLSTFVSLCMFKLVHIYFC